jgi:MFS family permease
MPEPAADAAPRGEPVSLAARLGGRLIGQVRAAYLPVLLTYFAFGASTVTSIAALYLQKDALALTPAQAADVAFWVALPWSMKMVAGVASDRYPILGSRRRAYLLLGALATLVGFALLATVARSREAYLVAAVLVAVGFMIQDVVADGLSVEVARSDEEMAQVQALGRMAFFVGYILAGGYLGGVLAGWLGPRPVFGWACVLPVLVAVGAMFVRERPRGAAAPAAAVVSAPALTPPVAAPARGGPLEGGNAALIIAGGLGYAALGLALELLNVALAQEIVLVVSAAIIVLLLRRVGLTRPVAVAAFALFVFRAVPSVGQGYSYWAIDRLGFDQHFLGILSQVSSVVGLVGLVLFRGPITRRPVSETLFWVILAGTILSAPNIGLFYGLHQWLGVSAHSIALVDTTITAPLSQLTMVPLLALIARTAPAGAEATVFAIMSSLMNLALSASELFTGYLNDGFGVTQHDYGNLGRLMLTVAALGLVPLLALPLLRREEPHLAVAPRPVGAGA